MKKKEKKFGQLLKMGRLIEKFKIHGNKFLQRDKLAEQFKHNFLDYLPVKERIVNDELCFQKKFKVFSIYSFHYKP